MERVTWRGTPGVGDFMWALNCVHLHAYQTNTKVNLEMHWEHGEDYLHHFEDPETIIERMNYIHNFYHRQDDVMVTHVFNSQGRYSDWSFQDDVVHEKDGRSRIQATGRTKNRFEFESGRYSDRPTEKAPDNDWLFRKDAFQSVDANKVVIWRPTFNAEIPRTWKRLLTDRQWDDIIKKLRGQGLNITELTYRTPVREAMYHIATCRLVFCYDGMWHYIAKNFAKPLAVLSSEGVTKYHTPHAIRVSPSADDEMNYRDWLGNIPELLGHPKKKSIEYFEEMKVIYD